MNEPSELPAREAEGGEPQSSESWRNLRRVTPEEWREIFARLRAADVGEIWSPEFRDNSPAPDRVSF